MALKAKLNSYYRSAKTGQPVFVYYVNGSEEELAAFKAAKKGFYREDKDGNVLHFATNLLGVNRNDSVILSITTNGNIVVDDLDKIVSDKALLDKYMIKEMAKAKAKQALAAGGVRAVATMQAQPHVPANELLNGADPIEVLEEEIPA